ncbi:O-antigen ligase family protein [Candidatus Marinimicrobia bacterium]|nr:O-antigen ligase family protein [Candidatus Neomarinimicrobiota bacterium]
MITTFLQISTYFLAFYILILSISKPEKATLLFLSTVVTRLNNFQNAPRILSPLTLDLIILIILVYQFLPYIKLGKYIKKSKIFLIWVLSHVLIRITQFIVYPDMSFTQVTSDIIGFYPKLFLIYLLVIGFCNRTNNFFLINKALMYNLILFCTFIYIEYFFKINYQELYGTIFSSGLLISDSIAERGSFRLLGGPLNYWVSSSTFLVSCFSIIAFYNIYKKGLKRLFILLLFIFTIFIIGARSAMVAVGVTTILYMYFDFNKKYKTLSLLALCATLLLFVLSPYSNFLFNSFNISSTEGLNFYRRVFVQIMMFNNIVDVPFIGYGFMGRLNTDLFQFQDLMEVNVLFTEIYDYGLLGAFFTLLFFIKVLFNTISIKVTLKNIPSYGWIGLFICFISNGIQEYIYFLVPVIFYSYAIWLKNNKMDFFPK